MRILLLEDDIILSELIEEFLVDNAYIVSCAYDGYEALDLINKRKFDILLLDVGVPNLNGFELLKYLKEIDISIPAIFITSLSSAKDVEEAFNIGCDDYIKKPFELKELQVRLDYLKKTHKLDIKNYEFNNGCIYNFDLKTINKESEQIALTLKEAQILEYFLKNSNRVVSLDELCANIWGMQDAPTYATIRTYIKNLRKILGKDLLTTLKGVGYKFEI